MMVASVAIDATIIAIATQPVQNSPKECVVVLILLPPFFYLYG